MTKEASYLRQCLDCNCNDCSFLIRDTKKLNKVKEDSYKEEIKIIETQKEKLLKSAFQKINSGKEKEASLIYRERHKIDNKKNNLNVNTTHKDLQLYGLCILKNKEISFIPNTIQLNTQECFIHRKDLNIQNFFKPKSGEYVIFQKIKNTYSIRGKIIRFLIKRLLKKKSNERIF
jgi:hypothetical protein